MNILSSASKDGWIYKPRIFFAFTYSSRDVFFQTLWAVWRHDFEACVCALTQDAFSHCFQLQALIILQKGTLLILVKITRKHWCHGPLVTHGCRNDAPINGNLSGNKLNMHLLCSVHGFYAMWHSKYITYINLCKIIFINK